MQQFQRPQGNSGALLRPVDAVRSADNADAKRRVLVIAFSYPPSPRVGALRPGGLAKYLPQFGWSPIVLTSSLDGVSRDQPDVVGTKYRNLLAEWKARFRLDATRGIHQQLGLALASEPKGKLLHTRVLRALKTAVTYPDETKGWISFAVNAIAEIAAKHRIDAIISTAPPFTTHMVGAQAKRILNCAWVADYRDLWNTNTLTMGEATGLMAWARRITERNVLRQVDALVTVSEPWAERLQARYPQQKVACIENGFDEEDFPFTRYDLTPQFTITHTGQLYQGRRDPTVLMETLRELLDEEAIPESDLRLRFYGPVEPFLPALVSRFGLEKVVEIHGSVPRSDALRLQRESQLLLLLTWWNPAESGILTGKVYEYLGSRRPILAVGGGRGRITALLEHTKAGVQACSKEDLKKVLIDAYSRYRLHGYIAFTGDEAVIQTRTHREMARKYAQLLESLASSSWNRARVA